MRCKRRICGLQFYPPRGVGLGKLASSFLGVAVPPRYPVRCVFKSAEGRSSNSCPWSESESWPHPIHTQWPGQFAHLLPLVKPACLVLMAFSSNSYRDLPEFPRFPSPSMVLYWGFYNYLCLLHPYFICICVCIYICIFPYITHILLSIYYYILHITIEKYEAVKNPTERSNEET